MPGNIRQGIIFAGVDCSKAADHVFAVRQFEFVGDYGFRLRLGKLDGYRFFLVFGKKRRQGLTAAEQR